MIPFECVLAEQLDCSLADGSLETWPSIRAAAHQRVYVAIYAHKGA